MALEPNASLLKSWDSVAPPPLAAEDVKGKSMCARSLRPWCRIRQRQVSSRINRLRVLPTADSEGGSGVHSLRSRRETNKAERGGGIRLRGARCPRAAANARTTAGPGRFVGVATEGERAGELPQLRGRQTGRHARWR